MNNNEFIEFFNQVRKEVPKNINLGEKLYLLDKLRKVTHTSLNDIDLTNLIKLLNASNETESECLWIFSSNFSML